MSGTSAHVAASPALTLPAPKLRLRSAPSGPTPATLHDGTGVNVANPVQVVLDEISGSAFDAEHEVEIRLFRYRRAKSRASVRPNGSSWAACRHVVGGVNDYNASQWLGGTFADGQDRTGRVLLAGLAIGAVVDLTPLWSSWMHMRRSNAWVDAANVSTVAFPRSTWMSHRYAPMQSYGIDANTEPARFAVAYVGRDADGHWQRLSSFARFMVTTAVHPWTFNPAHPDNIAPAPANPGRRIFAATPGYDARLLSIRLTESEWLAGGR